MVINFSKMRLVAAAVMAAMAFVSCDETCDYVPAGPSDPTPDGPEVPSVSLNNQFQVGAEGQPVTLQSAIYDVEDDGTYTFYLCNQANITTVADVLALDPADYVIISGVGSSTEPQSSYTVEYNGQTYTQSSTFDASEVSTLLYLDEATNSLKASAVFANEDEEADGEGFYLAYDGPVAEAGYMPVENAYAIGKENPTPITYVREERNVSAGTYTYYIYDTEVAAAAEEVEAEAVAVITIPMTALDETYDTEGAFTLAEGVAATFTGVELQSGAGQGGVSVENYSDATVKGVGRKINLTYRNGSEYYRLNYEGSVYATYVGEHMNEATVTYYRATDLNTPENGYPKYEDLGTVFYYTDEADVRTFVLSNYKPEATRSGEGGDIHDLKRDGEEGAWTIMFGVSNSYLADLDAEGKEFTLNELRDVKRIDYGTNTVESPYSADNLPELSVIIRPNPNDTEDSDTYYINFKSAFKNEKIMAGIVHYDIYDVEYYGAAEAAVLEAGESIDAVVSPTIAATFQIFDTNAESWWTSTTEFTPAGDPVFDFEIKALDVFHGTYRMSGNNYTVYAFCFRQDVNDGKVDDTTVTPYLVIAENALGTKLDMSQAYSSDDKVWAFGYNKSNSLSKTEYSCNQNYSTLVTKGWIEVTKNADNTFSISMGMYDEVPGSWSNYKTTVLIDAPNMKPTVYSGTKFTGNDFTGN